MDGPHPDIQAPKDLTIAQSVLITVSEEQSWMLTTKLASMQVLESPDPMLKSCQDSGSSKLDLVKELKLEITFG